MDAQPRTLEQRLKFDHGLTIGTSLVEFTHKGRTRRALVKIGPRGKVTALASPDYDDMYCSWFRIKGDVTAVIGGVHVWAGRDPEFMAQFQGEPVATVELRP
jgi:hypothetical protein